MKSVSSTLGRERMASDYNKAQQIKDRITRFSKQDNRVTLKYPSLYPGPKSLSVPTGALFRTGLSALAEIAQPKRVSPSTTRRRTSSRTVLLTLPGLLGRRGRTGRCLPCPPRRSMGQRITISRCRTGSWKSPLFSPLSRPKETGPRVRPGVSSDSQLLFSNI